MKFTQEERLDIGRRMYNKEISCKDLLLHDAQEYEYLSAQNLHSNVTLKKSFLTFNISLK